MDIRKRLLAGESFEKIAREEADDPSGKINEGRLGWFSAFAMVLPFENAAYHLQVGEISLPVRSRYGYHVIRLNGKRQSLGEVKLAHIMIRAGRNDNQEILNKAKDKINTCYQLLQNGNMFSDVARQYSEDAGSSQSGGQMRWLRSGELPPDIEELVFTLKDSGNYTIPVQSDYGWHIFRLEGKRPITSFNQLKSQLEERILADERGKLAEESFISGIKKEYGFILYPENISALTSLMDSSVYSGNWNVAIAGDLIEPVFTISKTEYTQKNLADYIVQIKRYRPGESLSDIVKKKCAELINKELITYEKGRLEEKYPAFKNLMGEYHDGILLFNIMDDRVWNKAVSDTTGLRAFHSQHTKDYLWQERADVSVYSLNDESYLKLTQKLAKKRIKKNWSAAEMSKMICKDDTFACVQVTDHTYEKGDPLPSGGFAWGKGFLKVSREDNKSKVIVVNKILPPVPKLFIEIRGQVTADYQNYLDQQWIETLRAKYPVVINNTVLRRIQ
jgi:peptidyl-prolyl cis-trans isomerase SurA